MSNDTQGQQQAGQQQAGQQPGTPPPVNWGPLGPPPPPLPLIRENALSIRDLGGVVRKLTFGEEEG